MKKILYFLLITAFLSCNNERVLQLPEIENAEVTEVLDVSPAYIFYDETQPDSTLFNRKNLIGTTNWLVNVDKRLTLRQAIPHIQHLQNKRKKASMHKNEAAKNYFTCNDRSIKSLGFLEFTDVDYYNMSFDSYIKKRSDLNTKKEITVEVKRLDSITLFGFISNPFLKRTNLESIINDLKYFTQKDTISNDKFILVLDLSSNISFQDYISVKSELQKIESDKIIIDTNEFIY